MNEPESQATTPVVGYFNPHPFPISLTISELGRSIALQGKDTRGVCYIVNSAGQKVNEPLFEKYLGQLLSKEVGKVPMPVVTFERVTIITPAGVGFQATTTFEGGDKLKPVFEKPSGVAPSGSRNPVGQMTVEQAVKLGVIGRPAVINDDALPADSGKGAPPQGDRTPTLTVARDITKATHPAAIPPSVNQVMGREIAPTTVTAITEETVTDAVSTAVSIAKGEQTGDLPLPQITEEEKVSLPIEIPAPIVQPATAKPLAQFICTECDHQPFPYRSELERHAKRAHADRLAQVMAPYPK